MSIDIICLSIDICKLTEISIDTAVLSMDILLISIETISNHANGILSTLIDARMISINMRIMSIEICPMSTNENETLLFSDMADEI